MSRASALALLFLFGLLASALGCDGGPILGTGGPAITPRFGR
jgi:hypothetical protein